MGVPMGLSVVNGGHGFCNVILIAIGARDYRSITSLPLRGKVDRKVKYDSYVG